MVSNKDACTNRVFHLSGIYANAIDSLKIGIEYFLREAGYSSRKHAILTVFHALELFLKEKLHRTNKILIYRKIDSKITEDSQTVGIDEALVRLENLGVGLPKEHRDTIVKIQKRRNRIEHHHYDHKEEDEAIIAEALSFILYFLEFELESKLEEDIPAEILREIQGIVRERQDLYWAAMHRLEEWMQKTWPEWNREEFDTPEEFQGTLDCPICTESFLVIEHHDKPFCFHCNTSVDAELCEDCGRTYLSGSGCCSGFLDEEF